MKESRQYIVPAMLATLLHVAIVVFMVAGFAMPAQKPLTPLAIQATLVQENASAPPPVAKPDPEPEPEPVEPEPEPPDTAELERQKRIEDARIEQERLSRIEEAKREAERERQRRADEEAKKRAEEEARKKAEEVARRQAEEQARRKAEEEARLEAARIEAERKRQEDIERQRAENERMRREAEARARQAEIDAEARRLDAIASGAREAYIFAIQQKITRNWAKPPSAPADLECRVAVRQLPGGDVVSVDVQSCNGDAAVVRSVESAVFRASPLPDPPDPSIFERNLTIIFKPRQ